MNAGMLFNTASGTPRRMLLIDVSALMFRSFWAFSKNPMARKDGHHTTALFGYVNGILRAVQTLQPTHIVAAMDTGTPNFRHELSPSYKGNRPPVPPSLVWQLQQVDRFNEALGIKGIKVQGFEADDVVGTISATCVHHNMLVDILSHDKDFVQLLSPGVRLVKSAKADALVYIDEFSCQDEYGITPAQMVDWLTLVGDAADNVVGVKGIGKMRATKVLQRFGSIENILNGGEIFLRTMENSTDKKEKTYVPLVKAILENRDNVILGKKLITINTNVPNLPSIENLSFSGFDVGPTSLLTALLSEYHMHNTLARFQNEYKPISQSI